MWKKKRNAKTKQNSIHPHLLGKHTQRRQRKQGFCFFPQKLTFQSQECGQLSTWLNTVMSSKTKIAEIHIFFTLHCCGEMFNKLVYNQDKSKGDTGDSDTRCQKNKNLTFAGKIQNLSILDCLVYLTYYL